VSYNPSSRAMQRKFLAALLKDSVPQASKRTVGRHVSLTGTSLWMFHVFQSRTPRLGRRNKEKQPDYNLSCKRPSVVACYYGTSLWRTVVEAHKLVNPWETNKPKSYSRNKRQRCPWTRCPSTTEWPVVNFAPRIARAGDVNTVNESTGRSYRYKSHNNDPISNHNGKGCIPQTEWS